MRVCFFLFLFFHVPPPLSNDQSFWASSSKFWPILASGHFRPFLAKLMHNFPHSYDTTIIPKEARKLASDQGVRSTSLHLWPILADQGFPLPVGDKFGFLKTIGVVSLDKGVGAVVSISFRSNPTTGGTPGWDAAQGHLRPHPGHAGRVAEKADARASAHVQLACPLSFLPPSCCVVTTEPKALPPTRLIMMYTAMICY